MFEVEGVCGPYLEYRGFKTTIEWDEDQKCFYCTVRNPIISSRGDTIDELMQSFKDCVDSYFEQPNYFQK